LHIVPSLFLCEVVDGTRRGPHASADEGALTGAVPGAGPDRGTACRPYRGARHRAAGRDRSREHGQANQCRDHPTTIENYAGEQIVYVSETIEANYATVRSKILTTGGVEIGVDYRLRRSAAGWLAFDVVLENVSLAANYRAQINRVLRTTSFATLLARMRAGQLTAMAIPRGAGKLQ
jgi:hypothetical protein